MWIAIAVFVLVTAGVIVLNIQAEKRRTHSAIPAVLSGLGSVLIAFSAVFAINMGIPSSSTQRPVLKEQVEDRYGLTLTDEQITELKYPDGRPDGELQTYGTTTVEKKVEGNLYRKQKIQLISENGKLKLAHYENGKGFEELPRKDTDR